MRRGRRPGEGRGCGVGRGCAVGGAGGAAAESPGRRGRRSPPLLAGGASTPAFRVGSIAGGGGRILRREGGVRPRTTSGSDLTHWRREPATASSGASGPFSPVNLQVTAREELLAWSDRLRPALGEQARVRRLRPPRG